MRRMISLALVLGLVFAAASVTAGGGREDDELTIEYWAYAGYEGNEADVQTIVDEFYDETGIRVEFQLIGWADIGGRVQAALLAGEAPDVLRDASGRLGSYANQGYAVPLDDMLATDYADKVNLEFIELGRINGQLLYMPTEVTAYAMIVNRTMFEEAGALDLLPSNPERSWTREEFEAALEAVRDEDRGIYGYALYAQDQSGDTVTKLMLEGGPEVRMYNDDFTEVLYDDPDAIEGAQWLQSLIERDLVYPGAASLHSDETWGLFQESRVAILGDNTETLGWANENMASGTMAQSDLYFTQFPHRDGSEPVSTTEPRGMIVFDNGDAARIDAAKQFVAFLSTHPLILRGLRLGGNIPVLSGVTLYGDDEPEMAWIEEYVLPRAVPWGHATPGYGELRTVLYPEIQAIYAGLKTPAEAMRDYTERANEILGQY